MTRLNDDTFSKGFETARRLLTHHDFSAELAAAIRRQGGVERAIEVLLKEFDVDLRETSSQQAARTIMGDNMLGTIELRRVFTHRRFNDDIAALLAEVPYSAETLKARAKTHVLIADVGASILEMQCIGSTRAGLWNDQNLLMHYWYRDDPFANATDQVRWRLIKKSPIEITIEAPSPDWQPHIDNDVDEIPSAREVFYAATLFRLARNGQIFTTVTVPKTRTSENMLLWIRSDDFSIRVTKNPVYDFQIARKVNIASAYKLPS